MTPSARRTYHLQYLRWHTQQERIAVRTALAHLRELFARIDVQLQAGGVGALSAMLDMIISESAFVRMLERIYTETGTLAAQNQYERLVPTRKATPLVMATKDKDPFELPSAPKPSPNSGLLRLNLFSAQWRQRMVEMARSSETALRVTQMATSTRQKVRDVLTRSAEQGWDIRTLTSKLRAVVADRKRARLIARTETTRAANAGHEAGAASSGIALHKVWISTGDARTRLTHRIAGAGKSIPANALFVVGGRNMRFPGDPAGGAENVCGCRCVVSFIPAPGYFNFN